MMNFRRKTGSSASARWMSNVIGEIRLGRNCSRMRMEQIPNLGDSRQFSWCVHWGGGTETRDHIPSKALLDDPLPENRTIVPACLSCNSGFSTDEEYLHSTNRSLRRESPHCIERPNFRPGQPWSLDSMPL
jgi:hypothetical protein